MIEKERQYSNWYYKESIQVVEIHITIVDENLQQRDGKMKPLMTKVREKYLSKKKKNKRSTLYHFNYLIAKLWSEYLQLYILFGSIVETYLKWSHYIFFFDSSSLQKTSPLVKYSSY